MSDNYVLVDRVPMIEKDPVKFARWFRNDKNRRVGDTTIRGVWVSTVFTGFDQSLGQGIPVLFETMIFGGEFDGWTETYHTWDEAARGHYIACAMIGASQSEN